MQRLKGKVISDGWSNVCYGNQVIFIDLSIGLQNSKSVSLSLSVPPYTTQVTGTCRTPNRAYSNSWFCQWTSLRVSFFCLRWPGDQNPGFSTSMGGWEFPNCQSACPLGKTYSTMTLLRKIMLIKVVRKQKWIRTMLRCQHTCSYGVQ